MSAGRAGTAGQTGETGHRAAVIAARLLAVLAVLAVLTAVALAAASVPEALPRLFETPEVVVGAAFSAVGAWLVGTGQARRIGWLLLAVGGCSALYALAASYAAFSVHGDVSAPLATGQGLALWSAWTTGWAWFPSWLLVSTVLPQVIPYGRPLPGWWRVPLWLSIAVLVVGVVALATAPGPVGFLEATENPLAVPATVRYFDPMGTALDVVVPVLVLVSLVSVVVRVVRADATERRQVGWFGYSVALAVLGIALLPSIWLNVAVLLVPAGLAVAALRYRLYDLDLVVNRTLVAGVLLGGAALAYVALVAWVGALVGTSSGITPFLAALAVALAFHPARVRVQRAVDRLFFGRRGDPYALLQDLDRTLRDAESPRAALQEATVLLQHGLRLPGVGVTVPMTAGGEVRASSGELPPTPTTVPLELHGRQVGTLTVAPRPGRPVLADADLRVLHALAGPLASAAYAARLSGDVEESRRRMLGAREEERRRLRRDLHDGLGPQLAGVVMGLDVVRSTLARGEAGRARELAETATEQARTAVDDVRRLVAGLRPPVLDDLGLVGALRSVGPAAAVEGPVVCIDADGDLDGLPAEVEVAAYRIVSEALTNVVRHADATRVAVSLRATGEGLRVTVEDDGRGIEPDAPVGVGLASMRERAAELGGWCTVGPGATGTRVVAMLPMGVA